MVSYERKAEHFKLWLNSMIEGVEETIEKENEKGKLDTKYMQGYLKSLKDIKDLCFDDGLFDLEV